MARSTNDHNDHNNPTNTASITTSTGTSTPPTEYPSNKAQIYSVQNDKDDYYNEKDHPVDDVDYRSQGGPRLTYLYSSHPLTGQSLYLGAEFGSDGRIYCIPGHAHRVLVIDPTNDQDKVFPMGPSFPGKYKWLRGIVVGDVIYGLPCNRGTVLRIHVPTQQVTELPLPYDTFYSSQNGYAAKTAHEQRHMLWKYHGGAVSPHDGCIYVIPQSAWHVLRIDPTTDECQFVGPTLEGKYKFYGGIVGKTDGAIYGIPHNAAHVLRILNADHITTHGDLGTQGHKWHGAAAAANGIIVSVPANADTVLCIQPGDTPTLFQLGSSDVLQTGRHRTDHKYKYLGALAGPDGHVYCFPSGSEHVLQINTQTQTVQTVGPNLYDTHMERICQNKWQNGVMCHPDQSVYGIPLSGESVLRIDCSSHDACNNRVTTWKLPRPFRLMSKYEGGVVDPKTGIMYTVPNNHKAVLRIIPPLTNNNNSAMDGSTTAPSSGADTLGNNPSKDTTATHAGDSSTNNNNNDKPRTCTSVEQVKALTQITDGDNEDLSDVKYRSGIATLRSSAHRVKANPKHRKQNPNPKDKKGQNTNTTFLPDSMCQEVVFRYNEQTYNLRQAFTELLKRLDPDMVGSFRNDNDNNSLEDFVLPPNTLHRKVNGGCCESAQAYMSDAVAADANFLEIFDRLVEEVVLPHVKQRLVAAGAAKQDTPLSFYIQRPPTLRIQPGPGRAGVKPHHDGEYGHQNGELNFWLPLTDRNLNQVDLFCESKFQKGDFRAILCHRGEIISFHGSSCRHFVNRNDSDKTRVSMDFRIGVEGFFDPYWQMSGTTDDHGRREVRI
ncbi:expressed unknown protein [Seminavis robusta]|uniref:Uncharacterized protein n=1 Tax=Seminavis robusta TaxID=568900 RepID=A0A9N8H2S3_9STRA|nr:expressed unknown protein [Seminavis robusta]|eukprot:Sro72_g039710.1 n/a (828) ;mRNA; r:19471-21954